MKIRIMAVSIIVAAGLYTQSVHAKDTFSQQQQILSYRAESNYSAAINLQSNIIDEFFVDNDADRKELSVSHYDLGVLLSEQGENRRALKTLKKCIEIIESLAGRYSPELVDPLGYLGITFFRLGNHDKALESFHKAQHIIHRTEGVKSVAQHKILDWISVVHLKNNDAKLVDTLQRFKYEIYRDTYGEMDPRTVPAMIELGNWLQSTGQYSDSVKAFRQAIEVSEEHNLPTTTLKRSLNGLAYTYYLKGECCADEYMTIAAEAVGRDNAFDNVEKSRAYIEAADMSLILDGRGQSQSQALYEEAWHYGSSLNQVQYGKPAVLGISRVDRMVRAYRPISQMKVYKIPQETHTFGTRKKPAPVEIVGAPLQFCAAEIKDLVKNRDYSSYVVDLNFDVLPNGRATDIKIVETNAPSVLNQLIRRMIRLHRFRPKLAEGVPVREQMQMRQTFGADQKADTEQFPPSKLAAIYGCHLLAMN